MGRASSRVGRLIDISGEIEENPLPEDGRKRGKETLNVVVAWGIRVEKREIDEEKGNEKDIEKTNDLSKESAWET